MVATQKLGVTIERAGHGQITSFSGDSRCRQVQSQRPGTERAAETLEYEVPGAWDRVTERRKGDVVKVSVSAWEG